MRVNTDGQKEYRTDLYERTADRLDEPTKVGAIDGACTHLHRDAKQKSEVMDYLRERLAADELAEVGEMLSTNQVPVSVSVEIETGETQ